MEELGHPVLSKVYKIIDGDAWDILNISLEEIDEFYWQLILRRALDELLLILVS